MSNVPIVYRTTHRIKFSELDPYDHVGTGKYATYYVDHRMEGLRESVGWDLKTLDACRSWSGSVAWRSTLTALCEAIRR